MMHALAWLAALCVLAGVVQQFLGTLLVERFVAEPEPPPLPEPPPVSVLKPLCGVEPLTELALESFFRIDYPAYQLVFGVQDAADPVLQIVAELRRRYPAQDVSVVVDETLHGGNRKVSNLINMLGQAKYPTLVMSDADIHVPPYFLTRVVSALRQPDVGLVTTFYTALPGMPHLATRLGAMQINYNFLPGALLGSKLGRQDCLGVTVALTRETLASVGGLQAVADRLADDQVLGRLVRAKGKRLAFANVFPATTVPESGFRELLFHELRWGRTIRALAPVAYSGSLLQIPLFWALLCLVFSGGSTAAWLLFGAVLLCRSGLARRLDKALRLCRTAGAGEERAWVFVLRDLLTFGIIAVSYCGNGVSWRGQRMRADTGRASPPAPAAAMPRKVETHKVETFVESL